MRFLLISILTLFLLPGLYGQNTLSGTIKDDDPFEAEIAFTHQTDSLYHARAYREIIDKCAGSQFSFFFIGVLTGAYYRIGNTTVSDSLLKDWIQFHIVGRVPFAALVIPSWGYREYLNDADNYLKIKQIYNDAYASIATTNSDTLVPMIIPLLMADQKLRGDDAAYYAPGALTPDSVRSDRFFGEENERQCQKVYRLYKQAGRLVKEDTGNYFFDLQFLLFAHDSNAEHRKFYLQLIDKAIADNKCPIERKMNFILRTEMMEAKSQKEFLETLPQREEELRKEYNQPDFDFTIY